MTLPQVWHELKFDAMNPFGSGDAPNIVTLSSYSTSTYFVCRDNVLYVSPTYTLNKDDLILITFAVFAKELGLLQAEYKTPTPDTSFKDRVGEANVGQGDWVGPNPM